MTTITTINYDIEKIFAISDDWHRHNLEHITFGTTFYEWLQVNLPNPEEAVKVLATCKCCERHQTKRPTILEKYEGYSDTEKDQKLQPCDCGCRHLSRSICRAFID